MRVVKVMKVVRVVINTHHTYTHTHTHTHIHTHTLPVCIHSTAMHYSFLFLCSNWQAKWSVSCLPQTDTPTLPHLALPNL